MSKKRYPIYGTTSFVKAGLYLGLFHGFTNEKKRRAAGDAGEWGANGPLIGPLKHVHTTYATHVKFSFVYAHDASKYGLKEEDQLTINGKGCIPFGRMQYGDWTVFNISKEPI